MYKGVGVRFADVISFFLDNPFGLIETKLFHFHRILKTGVREGVQANPPTPSGSAHVVRTALEVQLLLKGNSYGPL